jgi:MoaA/NifB/PqqE/SkfB family radical SAM enzyme
MKDGSDRMAIAPPTSVSLEVTARCNLACRHCYGSGATGTAGEPVSLAQISDLLDDVRTFGLTGITLLGGEPFLRPDIYDIIELCFFKGVTPLVITNGTLVGDGELAACRARGLDTLVMSIDGLPRVHDRIRANGAYARTMRAAARAKSRGFHIRVNTVVQRSNVDVIPALVRRLQGTVDSHKIIYYTPYNWCPRDEWLPPEEWMRFLETLKECYVPDMRTRVTAQQPYVVAESITGHVCRMGAAYISADGVVYPCVTLLYSRYHLGRLRHDRFARMWQAEWPLGRRHGHCVGYSLLLQNDVHRPVSLGGELSGHVFGCPLLCNKGPPQHAELPNLFIY